MFAVLSSPGPVGGSGGFLCLQIHFVIVTTLGLLTQTSSVVVRCQPWFHLGLVAYSFFWSSEGAYG